MDTNTKISNLKKERGASMVEYALLAALISVACIGSVRALGSDMNKTYNSTQLGLSGMAGDNANTCGGGPLDPPCPD